jgi:hypothetical protein
MTGVDIERALSVTPIFFGAMISFMGMMVLTYLEDIESMRPRKMLHGVAKIASAVAISLGAPLGVMFAIVFGFN